MCSRVKLRSWEVDTHIETHLGVERGGNICVGRSCKPSPKKENLFPSYSLYNNIGCLSQPPSLCPGPLIPTNHSYSTDVHVYIYLTSRGVYA